MLTFKSYRTLLVAAAVTALARQSDAGCNCSVPPSPSVSSVGVTASPWTGGPGYAAPGLAPVDHVHGQSYGFGYNPSPGSPTGTAWGGTGYPTVDPNSDGPFGAPGGYEPRIGSPAYYHDPAGGQYVVTGNPYYDHYGPGYHRSSLHGHYRFPYYTYRAPWYYPGKAVYNRNTNFPW